MTDDELTERLKDLCYELGLTSLRGGRMTSAWQWTHITVMHAGLLSDSTDGWDVRVEHGSL
jgi:hypothetical protein